jgi:MFS transporter, UMF1 family
VPPSWRQDDAAGPSGTGGMAAEGRPPAGGGQPSPPGGGQAGTPGLLSWALYDWANQSFGALIHTFVFSVYFTQRVAESETAGTTQWGTALGLAGLAVAVAGPVLGAMADQGGRRKPWIVGFTLLCVSATALLWFVEPSTDSVWLALILVGVATVGSELSFVFYNSMLPRLVPSDRLGRWSGWG